MNTQLSSTVAPICRREICGRFPKMSWSNLSPHADLDEREDDEEGPHQQGEERERERQIVHLSHELSPVRGNSTQGCNSAAPCRVPVGGIRFAIPPYAPRAVSRATSTRSVLSQPGIDLVEHRRARAEVLFSKSRS
jgi:hypothetical protein